jgi:hypothetical protein
MKPKFQVGDQVKIVRLLDETTRKTLIGKVGFIEEVDPLANGEYNYYVSGHYMHEGELEGV